MIRHPYFGSKPTVKKVSVSFCQITGRYTIENHDLFMPLREQTSLIIYKLSITERFHHLFGYRSRSTVAETFHELRSQTRYGLYNRCPFLPCYCHRSATGSRGVESITSCPAFLFLGGATVPSRCACNVCGP